jgi:beta-lactamase regulating signal transducer with metallopeptidase domain
MEMSILTWVLTYAVHSTVLIGCVWLLCTTTGRLALSTREILWKVALLGGVLTASLHMGLGARAPWGELDLPPALDTQPTVVAQPSVSGETPRAVEREIVRHRSGDMTITTVRERRAPSEPVTAPVAVATPAGTTPERTPWPWVILALAALGSIYAAIRLVMASLRLRRQLRGRRDVIEDPLLETFLSMCQKVGLKKRVKLTASAHLQSPVALVRREIVLPERAVDSLGPQQQEGMLAHELAHVLRRDPLWLWVAAVVEAVFFFQPLNHLARRRIQQVAELQCDDWAARTTGSGVHLAKCLAEVAAWVDGGSAISPTVAAMAEPRSPIVRRITRLLDDKRRKQAPGGPAAGVVMGIALLGFVTWLAPGIGRASVGTPSTSNGSSGSAPVAVANATSEPKRDVEFRDVRGEDGRDRSHLRVQTSDEIVEVEIERSRPPEPPPVPEPPRRGVRIHIEGSVWGGLFDPHWHGAIDVDLGDLDQAIEEMFDFGGPFRPSSRLWAPSPSDTAQHAHHAREHAHHARKHARHARDHAHRVRKHAHRARDERRQADDRGLLDL